MSLEISYDDLAPSGADLPPSPFTSADALRHGVTRWTLAQLVQSGQVRRVLIDVYVDGRLPDTLELRARAVRVVLPPHAVVVDRSAAWLWGVDLREKSELETPPPLAVFVAPGHKRLTRPQATGGERTLEPSDLRSFEGLQVTSPIRTALDLACGLARYEALAALDAFARLHGITTFDLMAQLSRYRGRRGVVQARSLVPLMDGRAESAGESFTRLAMLDGQLPRPTLQHWVIDDGRRVYRLDLAYPDLKICVEYDGVDYHSSAEQRAADARRRSWLRERGWWVLIVTKESFAGSALDEWLHQVKAAVRDRSR